MSFKYSFCENFQANTVGIFGQHKIMVLIVYLHRFFIFDGYKNLEIF